MYCHQCRGKVNNATTCEKCNFVYCCHACKMKDTIHKKLCGHCGTFNDFEVQNTEDGRGYGVFSKKKFLQGEILFAEKPIPFVDGDIKSTYIKQQVMYNLHPRPSRQHSLGEKIHHNTIEGKLYLEASFINHECMPNTQYYYMEQLDTLIIIALKDIDVDQEITISYMNRPHPNRKKMLLERYGFDCHCRVCSDATLSKAFMKLGICYDIVTDKGCSYQNSYKGCHRILEIFDEIDAPMLQYYEIYKILHARAVRNNDERHRHYQNKIEEYGTFFNNTFA